MAKYKREENMIIKALDLNQNKPLSYNDLRKICFHVSEQVFINILSNMFFENILVTETNENNLELYKLNENLYLYNIETTQKKKQSIIEANERQKKLKSLFTKEWYSLDNAKNLYSSCVGENNDINFEYDMNALGYNISNDFIICGFLSIAKYLNNEIMKLDIFELDVLYTKYEPLINSLDINYLLNKLKSEYKIIEFENNSYINIKRLNEMGIYISDIKKYCDEVYKLQKNGNCFTIKTLNKKGINNKITDLGMENVFYENLLRYDTRFLFYKMTNAYVFSISKKPTISNIVEDILKIENVIDIYSLQELLRKEYGITTTFVSDFGTLINQSILFNDSTTLFYSKEFEKIYLNKEDYYKEIEYDE